MKKENSRIVQQTEAIVNKMGRNVALAKVIRQDLTRKESDLERVKVTKEEQYRAKGGIETLILSEFGVGLAECCRFEVEEDWTI